MRYMYLSVRSREGIKAIPIDKSFFTAVTGNTLIIVFNEKAFSKDLFRMLHFDYDTEEQCDEEHESIMEWAGK